MCKFRWNIISWRCEGEWCIGGEGVLVCVSFGRISLWRF